MNLDIIKKTKTKAIEMIDKNNIEFMKFKTTNCKIPNDNILKIASKISIKTNKPINYQFYNDSLNGLVSIIFNNETYDYKIYKNDNEMTSKKINAHKVFDCYLFETHNYIYIISIKVSFR